MARDLIITIVAKVCGVILVAAVVLKIWGVSVGGVAQPLTMITPHAQLFGVVCEGFIGVWLLSGLDRRRAWFASVVLFTVLAGVSLFLISEGLSSCGCFGRVVVHPWLTFVLDATLIALLLIFRPMPEPVRDGQPNLLHAVVGAAAILVVAGGGTMIYWGTGIEGTITRLRGEALTLDPAIVELGEGVVGTTREFSVSVVNHTDQPLELIGGTSSCSCIVTRDLPRIVPARGRCDVPVTATFSGSPGLFQHQLEFYCSHDIRRKVTGRFAGTVVGN